MYSKHEATQLKQEFWTAFGQYMAPVMSAEGEKMKWVNYKTGEKNIAFRMHADNRSASIAIELTHKDSELQQLYFEQFRQLQHLLASAIGEEWTWQLHVRDEHGKIISKISTTINGVSIFRKDDWSTLITFFKPRIIALDEFWSTARYTFETLR